MSDWTANAEEAAAKKGLIIVMPGPTELFVDIDDKPSRLLFDHHVSILGDLVASWVERPSPSARPGRSHITVVLTRPVVDERERLLLQCLLGSDRLHEALSWSALLHGISGVTMFFEKPGAAALPLALFPVPQEVHADDRILF